MSGAPQIGPYTILGELGRGGMGVVYRARRADLEREFALKVILAGAGATAEMVQRFRREAQAAAALAGEPGIVGVHDIGRADDGSVYFAMDLVEGQSLEDVLAEGELTQPDLLTLCADAARAVARAHARGILHRDLKPANIMVETGTGRGPAAPRVRVTDFGLAKLEAADPELTRLTQSGEVLGTPAYMAPEQARGEHCTPAADVYALGATLYEALSGRPPFTGDSIHAVMAQVLTNAPPPLRKLNPQVPKPLEAIVHHCLAKQPGDRYPDAAALADDLDRFRAGEAIAAAELTARRAVGAAVKRGRVPLLAGAAVLLLAGGGLAWWAATRSDVAAADRAATATAAQAKTADLATQITGAWNVLNTRTGAAMQALDDHWVGHVPGIDVAGALAQIAGAAEAAQSEFPDTRLPAAWSASARALGGDAGGWEALREICESAGEDPTPHLLAMRIALAHYAREVRPARTRFDGRKMQYRAFEETDAQRDWRAKATEALQAAEATPLWGRLQGIDTARAFGKATAHLGEGGLAAAAESFLALTDDPQFGATARLLGGVAWFQLGEHERAADAWEQLRDRRWPGPMLSAAMARTGYAFLAMREKTDASDVFARAVAAAEAAMAWAPEDHIPVRMRGVVCVAWAQGMDAFGKPKAETLARLDEGIAAFSRVLELMPAEPNALIQRGRAYHMQGIMQEQIAQDPRAAYRNGVADASRVLAADPAEYRALALRGELLTDLAEATRDRAPAEAAQHLAGALSDLDAAIRQRDGDAHVRHVRATAWRGRGVLLSRARRDPTPAYLKALEDLDRVCASDAVRKDKSHLDRGHLLVQLAQARMDLRQDPREFLRRSLADLDLVLTHDRSNADALVHRAAAAGMYAVVQGVNRRPDAPERFRAAIDAFAQALELRPDDRNLWFNRIQIIAQYALFEQRAGRNAGAAWGQAAEAAELFAAKSPSDGEAQLLCAQLCWQVGKRNEAIAALDRAEALAAADPRLAGPVKALRRRMQGGR